MDILRPARGIESTTETKMIVTPDEMRGIEEAVFATGVTAQSLMDKVGRHVAGQLIRRLWRGGGTVLIYAGKGNNAGDALVAAKELWQMARECHVPIEIKLRLALSDPAGLGETARQKLEALSPEIFPRLSAEQACYIPARIGRLVVLDGLLGIGAKGPLREPIREATREINALQSQRGAYFFPSTSRQV